MRKCLTVIIMLVVCIFCLLVQSNLLSQIKLDGTSANIGIVLVGSIGLICGKLIGGLTGFSYGLMFDIAFGRMIGMYAGLYLLIGIISGLVNKSFSKESKTSLEMLILILTIIFEIFAYIILMILKKFEFDLQTTIFILIKESIFNMIIVFILFKPLRWLGEMINKGKNSYYLL